VCENYKRLSTGKIAEYRVYGVTDCTGHRGEFPSAVQTGGSQEVAARAVVSKHRWIYAFGFRVDWISTCRTSLSPVKSPQVKSQIHRDTRKEHGPLPSTDKGRRNVAPLRASYEYFCILTLILKQNTSKCLISI
jgi:hypothetical protein